MTRFISNITNAIMRESWEWSPASNNMAGIYRYCCNMWFFNCFRAFVKTGNVPVCEMSMHVDTPFIKIKNYLNQRVTWYRNAEASETAAQANATGQPQPYMVCVRHALFTKGLCVCNVIHSEYGHMNVERYIDNLIEEIYTSYDDSTC